MAVDDSGMTPADVAKTKVLKSTLELAWAKEVQKMVS